MTTFGKELIQSAHEALAIAQGRAEPAAVFVPETIDVAATRKRQKLSKEESVRAAVSDSASSAPTSRKS